MKPTARWEQPEQLQLIASDWPQLTFIYIDICICEWQPAARGHRGILRPFCSQIWPRTLESGAGTMYILQPGQPGNDSLLNMVLWSPLRGPVVPLITQQITAWSSQAAQPQTACFPCLTF